jgi:LemA protein
MMNKKWVVIGVFVAVVAVVGLGGVGAYNNLVTLNENINNGWAQVENVLQRRYDLIPNLVNTVKGYAKQEREVLEEVTRLRSQWGAAKTPADKIQAAQGLEGALSRLMVVVEKYPDLKSNQNFLALQDELAGTENRIAVERMRYNDAVRSYNVAVQRFPASVVARLGGFQKRDEYFEAEKGAEKAPEVKF